MEELHKAFNDVTSFAQFFSGQYRATPSA